MIKTFVKKFTAFTVAMCLLFSLIAFTQVSADDYNGTCGENIRWSIDGDTFTFSGTGEIPDFEYVEKTPWYNNNTYGVTKIVVENGITRIGTYSIGVFTNALEINIPKSVTDIEPNAFYANRNLTTINVDSANTTYTSVDGVLFSKDKTKLVFCPEGKTGMTYTVPNGVKTIGEFALADRSDLRTVVLPEGLEHIEESAFEWCQSLESIDLPSTLKTIGHYAFYGCMSFEQMNIPAKVTEIGDMAFLYCYAISKFTVDSSNTAFCCENDIILSKDKTKLVAYPAAKTDFEYTVPSTVKVIGDGAFNCVENLVEITLPTRLTTIGNEAFSDCMNLYEITIPATVTEIGWNAFYGCWSMHSINVDASNTKFCSKDGVLFNKDKTTLIRYPAGLEAEEYVIPNTVKTIGEDAFGCCFNLVSVEIPESVTLIDWYAFDSCQSLESIEIPESVKEIGGGAFCACESLISVTIPNSIKEIKDGTFEACMALEDVYFDGTPTEWDLIPKGDFNQYFLDNATMHFNDNSPAITRFYVDPWGDGGIVVETSFANAPQGAGKYIIAHDFYGNLVEIREDTGETMVFTNYDITTISACLWDLKTLKPLAPGRSKNLFEY